MAQIDEKARFYLERAVPELRDFEAKEIFLKDEIRTLVRKRREFEHLVLSPGSRPSDLLAYIDWEVSVDHLRVKRCQRLKIQRSSSHSAQARIFQLFERGITRHPGSGLLWRRYLDYAAEVKATKRWKNIMTRGLRMVPGDPHLWVLAGLKAAKDGDMDAARGIFMRGCRFCTAEALVWIEYARVEMIWLSKLQRKGTQHEATKALVTASENPKEWPQRSTEDNDNILFDEEDNENDENHDDFGNGPNALARALSQIDKANTMPVEQAEASLKASSLLDGAVPRAIFSAAAKQPFFTAVVAERFFDLFASFAEFSAGVQLTDMVLDSMCELFPNDTSTWICQVRRPLIGLSPETVAFPRALRTSLGKAQDRLDRTANKPEFVTRCKGWLDGLLARDDLISSVRLVLEDSRKKLDVVGVE